MPEFIPRDNSSSNGYPSEIYRLLKIGDNLSVPASTEANPVLQPAKQEQVRPAGKGIIQISREFYRKTAEKKYAGLLIYPIVFVLSFLFFYFAINLPSLFSQVQGFADNSSQDEQVLKDKLPAYNNWINGYYFSVGNSAMLSVTADIDKDGLSNMDEFLLRTNPTQPDSDNDGISDGIEIINQSNPWGQGIMSKQQKNLLEGVDMIMINNRISYNVSVRDNSGEQEKNVFDTGREGRLSIPKLGMQVPIIWSKSPDDFDADLQKGVIHYPGTAMPGENGIVYISGHSSDYLWKKHPYKQIFAKINFLDPGDDIFVDVYGADGKLYNFRYKVVEEKVYKPDDQTQFIDSSKAKLNLSTCWPIGTQKDRYVVSAVLQDL